MTTRSWLDEEPPATAAVALAGRLFMAGLQRKVALMLAGTLYAAVLTGAVVWKKYSYTPEYVLRVVEADEEPTSVPTPRRELAEYVRKAIFTSEPLLDLIRRHGLYPSFAQKNPRAALESFREDIDVEVRKNYFIEDRALGAAPRSARLIIRYHTGNADVATSVIRDLGELVVKREQAMRRDAAERAADLAREQVDEAREALASRRSAVASLRAELDRAADASPDRRVAYIGLLGALPSLEKRQDEIERRQASMAIGAAMEQRGIGMSFQVVEDGLLPSAARAKSGRVLVAGVAFVFGMPLVAIALGAFAPRRARS